ncbi:MAG TPA: GIY-YIG nuclease family protein [Blastocatellia bacterium]|nr:GIY-YIG nuclease family protein [Blastocatellia bacterium]
MKDRRKELKEEYKLAHTPMGVYQVRNLINGKLFVGAALNLPGILNSIKLQLKAGSHPNKKLQAEWNELGGESFAFEVLDELTATEGAGYDYKPDLAFLEELWLEKLQPYGDRGYNEKKRGREERLREMAQRRLGNR